MSTQVKGFDPADIEQNKTMAGVGYLVPILPFILMKDSKFIKFHANQILVFGITAFLVCGLSSIILIAAAASLNFTLMAIVGFLSSPLYLVCSILSIMNMIAAFRGEAKRYPIVGKYTLIPNSNDVEAEDVFKHEFINKLSDKVDNVSFSDMASMVSRPCPSCNQAVTIGKKFCNACGCQMPELVKVPKATAAKEPVCLCGTCGKEYTETVKFCMECGGGICDIPKAPIAAAPACINCGLENESGAKFCPQCGGQVVAQAVQTPKCNACHFELEQGARFCPQCGTASVGA